MPSDKGSRRRDFLKGAALASTAALSEAETATTAQEQTAAGEAEPLPTNILSYPRRFTGRALSMISFPLGGIGAGSIGIGGRGQLRDWEICNRADKGNSPDYAFASIWIKPAGRPAITRVLESQIEPPYEGQDGLGSRNAPGLSRLDAAIFTGEFPLCRIDFRDRQLPVSISLEAGTPFIPLDADNSGLPVAVLRYRVRNTSQSKVEASIAFSVDNPVRDLAQKRTRNPDSRKNEVRRTKESQGVFMRNPALDSKNMGFGSFALVALQEDDSAEISVLSGWPAGRWWTSPLLFWDDFSADGKLGPENGRVNAVGSVSVKQSLAPAEERTYTFLLAWHFPNRTPERCGWTAPKGHENTIIGNWYAARYADAWEAVQYMAAQLAPLQERTQKFAEVFRTSSLPSAIKEAASANLSTLVTQTCFRTADGEFHGFEGINDQLGCCHGNCTHVWNYETATAHLFPSLSQSLRRAAFGYSMDNRGAMYFRQNLPDGIERLGFVAADGQMGQIMKVYLDWQLSGDAAFLKEFWPKAKKALEFCWVPGGWDANRDGVMEGVQHNTYDVEFYGPNPLCSIYYLGALRAAEEMAKASGDAVFAAECRRIFESGSKWIDANLFNGEYYIQQVRGIKAADIAPGLIGGMGAENSEKPEYQVGNGCLIDQLLGQYLADLCALGPLVNERNIQTALQSIYKYNHKASLAYHDCVERTFALNDESAMVICDYGKGVRPKVPFPYYAEVMTGFEHATAALMLYRGMTDEGLRAVSNIRHRYDGVGRNPWDEAECGHHYARAMASWSSFVALSGFRYAGSERHVIAVPRWPRPQFQCFWSAATGWGTFEVSSSRFALHVVEGSLPVASVEFMSPRTLTRVSVRRDTEALAHTAEPRGNNVVIKLNQPTTVEARQSLTVEL
jgi:uncharacterized protein (DUF608 family)